MIEHTNGFDLRASRRARPGGGLPTPQLIDRLPPHSLEAEQGVLGCMLISPKESIGLCIERFKAVPDVFYDLRHQAIFEILTAMYDTMAAIDGITVQQKLKDKNQLEAIGGLAYLTALMDSVPSAANLEYYVEILREKYLLRRIIQTCTGIVGRVYEAQGDVEALLDQTEREILAIAMTNRPDDAPVKDLVHSAIQAIEEDFSRKDMTPGLPTGLVDLDRQTGGLHNAEMVVLAARPSCGKTSLAMNIAEYNAVECQIPTAVFSLETGGVSLIKRTLSSRARVNLRAIKDDLADQDFPKLVGAAEKIANAQLYIADASSLSLLQFKAKARRLYHQHGVRLFVIDYLQLMETVQKFGQNRDREIGELTRGIKSLAMELNVAVLVLSQLNRELDKEKNRKPRLSDLRESGSIEQDADQVWMLYKPRTEEEESDSDVQRIDCYVAKHRNGGVGVVPLTFLKCYTRFESAAKINEGDRY